MREKLSLRATSLDPGLRAIILKYSPEMRGKKTARQVMLLPFRFSENLRAKSPTSLVTPTATIEELSLAHYFGWTAHQILDQALDENDHAGLPLCVSLLRELTSAYCRLFPEKNAFWKGIMEEMDGANAEEQELYRFDPREKPELKKIPCMNPSRLASKSIGHSLPCLALLMLAGYEQSGQEYSVLISYFRHYLSARQQSDDIYDWEEDLARGTWTLNTTSLMRRYVGTDAAKRNAGNTACERELLRTIFLHEVLPEMLEMVAWEITCASQALIQCGSFMKSTGFLQKPLDVLWSQVEETKMHAETMRSAEKMSR